jgi:hypothetical protein
MAFSENGRGDKPKSWQSGKKPSPENPDTGYKPLIFLDFS